MTPPMLAEFPAGPAVPKDVIWRFSVRQYHDMIGAGILSADDPVELLDGWLVYKMPKKPLHRLVTQMLREAYEGLIPTGWHVNVQEPVTTPSSEPEPDISVVRGPRLAYRDRHPEAADLGLVVEVSDTTLERDQGWKKAIYARAGIALYWIINLLDRRVEVYLEPSGPTEEPDYRVRNSYDFRDEVPFVLDGQNLGSIVLEKLLNG